MSMERASLPSSSPLAGPKGNVAYSLLPEELKVKLHRAAATHYEQLLHDQAGQRSDSIVREGSTSSKKRGNDLVNILAQHWKHAGQSAEAVAKAVDYLTMAGDQALAKFAIKEAKLLHEEALERLPSDNQQHEQETRPSHLDLPPMHA